MSWLFGIKNQTPPQAAGGEDDPNKPAPAPLTNSERKAMEAYRFDSSALERAAEAAKTLERSSEYNNFVRIFKGKQFKLNNFIHKFEFRTRTRSIRTIKITRDN